MNLVTLAQARAHLRIDEIGDDPDLDGKIAGASAAVLKYIGDSFDDSTGTIPLDSAGNPDVPDDVIIATLLLIGDFYKNREPTADDAVPADYGYGYLPRAVVALLYPYRMPSIA